MQTSAVGSSHASPRPWQPCTPTLARLYFAGTADRHLHHGPGHGRGGTGLARRRADAARTQGRQAGPPAPISPPPIPPPPLDPPRARARAAGVPVRGRVLPQGFRSGGLRQDFRFEGLRPSAQAALPSQWLDAGTVVHGQTVLQLGPEPLIGPQQVQISHPSYPGPSLPLLTHPVRPFAVESVP